MTLEKGRGRPCEAWRSFSLTSFQPLGWFHRRNLDWGSDGAARRGSGLRLSAGAWKRHDPEGVAEGWETEEEGGEEDTVKTWSMWVGLGLWPLPWSSFLCVKQEAEERAVGNETQRLPPAAGGRRAPVCSLPQGLGSDLWPRWSLRGMSAARLQWLQREATHRLPVEVQCLRQDLVSSSHSLTKMLMPLKRSYRVCEPVASDPCVVED